MANAKTRRQRNRLKFLSRLAREDPDKFLEEWDKRLESWEREAHRRAGRLLERPPGRDGEIPGPKPVVRVKASFAVLDEAMELLDACGIDGVDFEWGRHRGDVRNVTRTVLTEACAAAVAGKVDSRLYPATRMGEVCRGVRQGTHALRW